MRRNKDRYRDGERSSIGHDHVLRACTDIDNAMLKDIAAHTPEFSVDYIVRMLFKDEDVALVKQAAPLLHDAAEQASYSLIGGAPALYLNFGIGMAALSSSHMHWQPERAADFVEALRVIGEKRVQWGKVKYVLRWLDKNATPGAIRALWPCVMSLCKTAPALLDMHEAPTRYTQPMNIAPLLPLLRDAAATVALMSLLPETLAVRSKTKVGYLTCGATVVTVYDGVPFNLDYINVGL